MTDPIEFEGPVRVLDDLTRMDDPVQLIMGVLNRCQQPEAALQLHRASTGSCTHAVTAPKLRRSSAAVPAREQP